MKIKVFKMKKIDVPELEKKGIKPSSRAQVSALPLSTGKLEFGSLLFLLLDFEEVTFVISISVR